ncbi:unnamed protein product [Diabrotica balteata]|uniref:Ubiquitin carboxyl-terminal hydrolase 7 ICP0-binding domain-containing protein n=1 Tax=Diabrotica balteata TaxID=107213 RepID=A0A9N9SSK6_DIABA|nr:unnamed protein product [Diabrotica balteata]
MIEKITNFNDPLKNVLEELMDGDILVFENEEREELSEVLTGIDYFKDLYCSVEVTCRQMHTQRSGIHNGAITENDIRSVHQRVGTDPYLLQFFECQSYKDSPGYPLRCTFEGTLKNLLVYSKPKVPKKIFYQQRIFYCKQNDDVDIPYCGYVLIFHYMGKLKQLHNLKMSDINIPKVKRRTIKNKR